MQRSRGGISMACSTILAPAPSHRMPLSLPCRPSLTGSFKGLPLKQPLFFRGVCSLREILLSAAHSKCPVKGPANLPALQVVNSQKKQVNSGSESEGNVLQSRKPSWDGTNALVATEGFCIVVAAASYTTSVFRNKQASLVASSSAGESKFLPRVGDLSTWYVPALWAALAINAVLRTVQRRSSTKSTQKVWEERSIEDFTLDQRVGKLEEDLQGVTSIAQMLSRHLEKLGVRFRVTRRTLRDPIQETVLLSQKTSEVVRALASREQALEKELEETQRTLVAMQTQQAKQLELLVSGMAKTLKTQQASERRILKVLSRHLGGVLTDSSSSEDIDSTVSTLEEKGGGPPTSRKQQIMKDIGTLWKGFKKNPEARNSSSTSSSQTKGQVKEERKTNGHASVTPKTTEGPTKKSIYNPGTSFTKEDFWATATPRETSASSQTVRTTDAEPQQASEPQSSTSSSGRLDAFFHNKKRIHVPQHGGHIHERDFGDPGVDQRYSQSGEHSSSSKILDWPT